MHLAKKKLYNQKGIKTFFYQKSITFSSQFLEWDAGHLLLTKNRNDNFTSWLVYSLSDIGGKIAFYRHFYEVRRLALKRIRMCEYVESSQEWLINKRTDKF